MIDWSFIIPGDPVSVNQTYKIVYIGKRCSICGRGPARLAKAAGVEAWQAEVGWLAKVARPSGWEPARRTIVEVDWYTTRPHDSDNGLKALGDGLAIGLGCNDKGFLMRAMSNEVDKAHPRTIVRIRNHAEPS